MYGPRGARGAQNYPLILADPKGRICVAFNQGGHVYFEVFSSKLRRLAKGDLGRVAGRGRGAERACGFVAADGSFRIVF